METSFFFAQGVEFVIPGIYKASPREWAEQFLDEGKIYFTNLEIFLTVGPVTYDKEQASCRKSHLPKGMFQKDYCFSGQKEYRFALVGKTCLKNENHIILYLGNCNDIARIV